MSNSLPKYKRVKQCGLDPWDKYKEKKFGTNNTATRLSRVKNCAKINITSGTPKGTSNYKFRGVGMGGASAAGFANVQDSSTRTSTLANKNIQCIENESGPKPVRSPKLCTPIGCGPTSLGYRCFD
jgi:hypothetical protein